jgi:hypothetical protein
MLNRRHLLQSTAVGFPMLALRGLLDSEAAAAPGNPLAGRQPHHTPRAKRILFLFMKGGPSQVDTFDYKPRLQKDHGQPLPFDKPRVQFAPTGKLLGSPWSFSQHGDCGLPVSELFPHTARHADDLCVINSVHGTNAAHGGALLKLHTGSDNFVRPSIGSWVSYGLGTENSNLPAFVTICPTLAHGGVKNWGSAFLPAPFQGTPIGNASLPSADARVPYLQNTRDSRQLQRLKLDLLGQFNRKHLDQFGEDSGLEARINSFELAFRMQNEIPDIQDLSKESAETHRLYGLDQKITEDFGRQCLLARRFLERGVRFVQVTHSDTKVQWDQHSNLIDGHTKNAMEVDQPIGGLLTDLKARGLLEDTLVWWGGEFGRTPCVQGSNGRDHNPDGFTMWLAGGGAKPATRYGATDEFGYYAALDKVHIHDLHATILHLLGLDHLQLTHRYAGRDFRLTDVYGDVVDGVIA